MECFCRLAYPPLRNPLVSDPTGRERVEPCPSSVRAGKPSARKAHSHDHPCVRSARPGTAHRTDHRHLQPVLRGLLPPLDGRDRLRQPARRLARRLPQAGPRTPRTRVQHTGTSRSPRPRKPSSATWPGSSTRLAGTEPSPTSPPRPSTAGTTRAPRCASTPSEMRALGAEVVEIGTGGDPFHAPARALYEKLGCTPFRSPSTTADSDRNPSGTALSPPVPEEGASTYPTLLLKQALDPPGAPTRALMRST